MVFKRIEMQGFKSFADKTEIDFLTGVTGIVGPNGCGKSNIADGVRWVLGEQSTKTLRGKSMTDVIFSGTEKRKRHGFAEVSLIFDNKTALFDLPYNEIYFTRKIYGDGESEYLINKKQARMKDIQALLSGIGIGKEGYSIIGQGRVEQIISAKPEDRRVIFEEASGIAGTKRKKQESERKLERSRENRERLLDIIKEQERTLKPLEKQAANAQVYLKLRDRLKHLEINNFIYRFETTSETKKNLSVKIKTVSKELEDKTKELEKLNVQYVETAAEINAIDSSLAKIHEEILNLSLSLERSEGDTKLSRERLEFFRTQYESLTAEVLELEKTQRQIKEEIDQGSFEIRQKNMDLKGLSRDKEEATKTYLEIIDALTAGEDELSKNQNALYLSLETLADVKAAISEEEARIEISTQRTKDLETQIQLEEGKKERATEDLRQAKIKLAAVEEGIRAMLNKRSETLKALNTLRTEVAELEEEVGILKTRESVSSNRLKLLKDIKESGEGYGHSVKRLMDAGRMHPEVKRLYDGTVGSLFKTTERYEVAIETALGSAISNIIVHSEEDAKKLIGLMKKNNMGRLTFLPTLSVKPRNIKREYESAVRELAVANAVDVISFDKAHRSVFESLLGGTVVCENLDRAVRLAQRTGYDFKIVTLDGEVLSTAGAISGGSRKNEGTSVISRDREIEELEKTVKETQEAYAKKSSLLTDKRLERIAKERELEVIVEQIKKIEIEENNFKNAAEVKNSSANLAMENINSLTKEKATEAKTIKDAQTKIDGIRIRQNSIMSGKAHADESMLIRQKQFENLKIERDKFNEIITDTKVKIAHVEKEIAAINDTNFRLDNQREEIEKKLIAAIDAKQKTEKTIESQEKLLLEKSKEKGGNKTAEQLETVRTKLRTMDTYKKEKSDSLVLTEERRQRLSQEVTSIAEKKFNEELALGRVDSDIEFLQERIFEEYALTFEGCKKFKEEGFNATAAEPEIAEIKKEISKLGSINVNAIEDIVDLKNRYEEYTTQKADLEAAEADILKAIKELGQEMAERFDADFREIQENFKKSFSELFGGGTARLELVKAESGDPLDAGIEIIAQPPGKKLQSITLLSGGEKALTAISILFAILKLRPMPFCILDEIEAALDEANVTRFANYLKRFAKDTQFIVITHRKPTMQIVDNLYGVTMPEKGVSKIVSVKLSEAEKMSEQK